MLLIFFFLLLFLPFRGDLFKQESLANAKVARDSLARQKADFDVKLALKVILGHLFCNQLQADKG